MTAKNSMISPARTGLWKRSSDTFSVRKRWLRDSSDAVMPATLSMRAIMSPPNIASFRAMSMFRTISREMSISKS